MVRYYLAHILFFLTLTITSTICIPYFLLSPYHPKNSRHYAVYVGRFFTVFFGVSWEIRGGHNFEDETGGAVIVANHQHVLDLVGMFNMWHLMGNCSAVAKKEFFYNPFGVASWLAGVVFIDRKNSAEAHNILRDTAKNLNADNFKMFLFPEGTRNSRVYETKEFLPFKKGAFRIAIQAQVPIIPVIFSPYYFIDDREKTLDYGGKAIISILPPIPTKGLTVSDMDWLIQTVSEVMQLEFLALHAEIEEKFAGNSTRDLPSKKSSSKFICEDSGNKAIPNFLKNS